MMPTPRLLTFASVTFALVACSSPYSIPQPSSDGTLVGGGSSEQQAPAKPDGGSTPPSGGPSEGEFDAGPEPDASSAVDTGSPTVDAGVPKGVDSGSPQQPTPPAQGPLGSCTNPVCGTDLNECGCQATASNGDTVQMGCQAGGQCICLLNNNQTDQPFDENGACGAQASTVEQFLTNCPCQ